MLLFVGGLQGVEIGSGGYDEAINLLSEEILVTMVITMCPMTPPQAKTYFSVSTQHTYNSMSL
jgi:hypothetical protein